LDAAARQLDAAEAARDRVAALTATIRAFEEGLAAMRAGLREAAIREAQIDRDLAARDAELGELLGVLQALGRAEPAQQLLHPEGPLGAARAGMLVASVTPALAGAADRLRADLEEVATLRRLQQDAAGTLQEGLAQLQEARAGLSQAIADRGPLPRKFTEDAVRTAILIAASETLEGFASGLSEIAANGVEGDPLPRVDDRKGALPLPVAGEVLRRAGETDAAGVTRPGIVVATRPRALVSTPVPATLRYRGPLLDYGIVAILEPQPDLLVVLAGLDVVYGETGEVLPEGAPVGLMPGEGPDGDGGILSPSSERGLTRRSETLYIEVREGNRPVDPLTWFATDKG
ncbi:murein hydrolase activator EnvC family protein, partial [Roseivivax isoporae]